MSEGESCHRCYQKVDRLHSLSIRLEGDTENRHFDNLCLKCAEKVRDGLIRDPRKDSK